jgi:hypothetical protein
LSIAGRILDEENPGKKSPSLRIRIGGGDDSKKANDKLDSSPTKGSLTSFSSAEIPSTPKSITKFNSDILPSPIEREIIR